MFCRLCEFGPSRFEQESDVTDYEFSQETNDLMSWTEGSTRLVKTCVSASTWRENSVDCIRSVVGTDGAKCKIFSENSTVGRETLARLGRSSESVVL